MTLTVDLLVRRGTFTLDASVRVEDGETLALLGPNGSGKSTLLAAIAGLLIPERASIDVNGRVLTSVGAGRRATTIAPHERGVGLLGQDPLLFPHLSARENIAFGLRAKGVPASSARSSAETWLQDVGLAEFADRLPSQLSGGQQQRVAIGRALAAEPSVLLLDEPMAALDVQNAAAVRTLLRERLAATSLPTIVVTHDVVDAMVLADRVAILDDGRIVDMGDPVTVLGRPQNLFAAKLVGLNLFQGVLENDGSVRSAEGKSLRSSPGGVKAGSAGDTVTASFPPSAVRMTTDHASSDDGFSWRATVGALEPSVAGIRVPFVGETVAAELTTVELLASGVREGMVVWVSVDPQFVTVYPAR